MHLLRILYTTMLAADGSSSESALLNCEALLEQACALLPLHVCTAIVQQLEHAALAELHASIHDTTAEKNDMGAYIESNGVPCVSASDVRLLLLLFRSSAATSSLQRGGGGGGGRGAFLHLLPRLLCAARVLHGDQTRLRRRQEARAAAAAFFFFCLRPAAGVCRCCSAPKTNK